MLPWPDIRCETSIEHQMTRISIHPHNKKHSSIQFVFNEQMTFLIAFGFGEWHCHPEIEDAMVMAEGLIRKTKCLLEEWDNGNKRYIGSGLVEPGEILSSVRGRSSVFRRLFFNQEPIDEKVDFSLYIETKHGFHLRSDAERQHQQYKELGVATPQWLREMGFE